ncbi:hypothetical protein [Demequina muriae]|uniref:Uncharacterized protein n=1 Tax=Demequina muriae TaxID=3051664 RepID=A0ABT8GGJ3_9MICO|nr:hypothetical protein [Demequina sp. EGI L300058]MDN4480548.1 hypothetical protein [Demequina sp. EGI L300058]
MEQNTASTATLTHAGNSQAISGAHGYSDHCRLIAADVDHDRPIATLRFAASR